MMKTGIRGSLHFLRTALALVMSLGVASAALADIKDRNPQAASMLLQRIMNAVGGATALQSMTAMMVQAQGERWILDESFVPGVGGRSTFELQLAHDLTQDRMRLDYDLAGGAAGDRELSEVLVGNVGFIQGQDGAGQPVATRAMLSDRLASIRKHQLLLNPLLLLREVADDPGQITGVAWDFVGGAYRVLYVAAKPAPLRLYLESGSGRPVKLLTSESDPLRRDVPLEVRYADWATAAGSTLQYPARVEVFYDGELIHAETRALAVNTPVDAAMFEIPTGISPAFDAALETRGEVHHQYLQSFAAYGFPREGLQPQVSASELVPGVFFLTGGSHNSLAVVQQNGVVIVEAPLDEVRSRAVLDWVEANLPGKPVTHTVMSHHHADHSAGQRTYVAEGATSVMHETVVPFFREVFTARSRLMPDALSRNPRAAQIMGVPGDGSVILPDAVNPVGIYPMSTPHAADLVIVEAGGVVFVVDIYSPFPGATQLPAGARLLQDRIVELGLQPEIIAGGHGGTIPYSEFTNLLSSAGVAMIGQERHAH